MLIIACLFIIYFVTVIGLYQKSINQMCISKRRLDGKTAIVTGGTSGMGLEIAKDFAERGARVIVACPFGQEGTNARKTIIEQTGHENVVFKLLDLASLESVKEFANSIKRTEDRLDILVNNAGVGVPEHFITADGMNFVMQVNYFGHFLLTLLLLPLLKKTGTPTDAARIVNVSSQSHRNANVNFDNLNPIGVWINQKLQIYGNSKLCLILFSRELTKKIKESNVVINNADPGVVGTPFFDKGFPIGKIIKLFYKYLSKTAWEGAQTTIHIAVDKKAGEVSGEYFCNCQLYEASKAASNSESQRKLWEESLKFVKLSEKELTECFA